MPVVAAVALVGCRTGDGLAGDTARITLDGRTVTVPVDSCGLDGDTFVLVAAGEGTLLQVLLHLDGDGDARSVDREASAVSVDVRGDEQYAAGDATVLGVDAGRPGTLDRATIRGDRIEIEASTAAVTGAGGPDPVALEVAARCPGEPVDEAMRPVTVGGGA